jgi:hypothetical protein
MPKHLLYSLLAGHTGGFILGVLLRFAIVALPPSFQEGFWEAFLHEGQGTPIDSGGEQSVG